MRKILFYSTVFLMFVSPFSVFSSQSISNHDLFHQVKFSDNPLVTYLKWIPNPRKHKVAFITVSSKNKPKVRMIYVHNIIHDGVLFYSNPSSYKIKNIQKNPSSTILVRSQHNGIDESIVMEGVISPYKKTKTSTITLDVGDKKHTIQWSAYIFKPSVITFNAYLKSDKYGVNESVRYKYNGSRWSHPAPTFRYFIPEN